MGITHDMFLIIHDANLKYTTEIIKSTHKPFSWEKHLKDFII